MLILRWLCVPIAAVALVVASVIGSRSLIAAFDSRCAADNMVGGACVEAWQTALVEWIIYGAVALTVVGLCVGCAAIAPRGKRGVAICAAALSVGFMAVVSYVTGWADLSMPLVIAVVVATLSIFWVWSWGGNHGSA